MGQDFQSRCDSAFAHLNDYYVNDALNRFKELFEQYPSSPEVIWGLFSCYAEISFEKRDPETLKIASDYFKQYVELTNSNNIFPKDYKVEKLLGVGSMSYVFKVDQGGHSLALKVIKERFKVSEKVRSEFVQQVERLKKIEDSHVVRVVTFDKKYVEDFNYQPFYVMEYIKGFDLKSILLGDHNKQKILPLNEILEIVDSICKGIKAAYDIDTPVIHCDLKPENILYDSISKTWKIIDFGMSLFNQNRGLLETKFFAVTPFYSAPEILAEKKGDHRSDIYSIGKLIAEMLLGKRAVIDHKYLTNIKQEDISIAYVIDTCTEVDPNLRYDNIDKLIKDLDKVRQEQKERENIQGNLHKSLSVIEIVSKLATPSFVTLFTTTELNNRKSTQLKWNYLVTLFIPIFLIASLSSKALFDVQFYDFTYMGNMFGSPSNVSWFWPTWLVLGSFTILGSYYYHTIILNAKSIIDNPVSRFVVTSFGYLYIFQVLVAIERPDLWGVCSAACMAMTLISNLIIYNSTKKYVDFTPERNKKERQILNNQFLIFSISSFFYMFVLILVNVLIKWLYVELPDKIKEVQLIEIIIAIIITSMNIHLIFNTLNGKSSNRLKALLIWESYIRSDSKKLP